LPAQTVGGKVVSALYQDRDADFACVEVTLKL
jgi:hypothetical protein